MKRDEFEVVVSIVSNKIRRSLDREDIPDMTLSAFRINKMLTDEHVIKSQAFLINELCQSVDLLKSKVRFLEGENNRLRIKILRAGNLGCELGVA